MDAVCIIVKTLVKYCQVNMLCNSIVWNIYMTRVKLYLETRQFVIIVLTLPFLHLTADIRKMNVWWIT